MTRCHVFGHRPRFAAVGTTVQWECLRCGSAGGARRYATSAEAARYARGLNHQDSAELGRRAPLVALLPLRLARAFRRHPSKSQKSPPSHG